MWITLVAASAVYMKAIAYMKLGMFYSVAKWRSAASSGDYNISHGCEDSTYSRFARGGIRKIACGWRCEILAKPIRPLRQHQKRMLRAEGHYSKNFINPFVRHAVAKHIPHEVDGNPSRLFPSQRLIEAIGVSGSVVSFVIIRTAPLVRRSVVGCAAPAAGTCPTPP